MIIQAEISLYPLGNEDELFVKVERFIELTKQSDISVDVGNMSTTIIGKSNDIFAVLHHAFEQVASHTAAVMVVKVCNICPLPSRDIESND